MARFAPLVFAVTLPALPLLLWLRSAGGDAAFFWRALAAVFFAAAAGAVLRARRRFEDIPGALVRLEDALSLHNRLTAAREGVGAWPPIPDGGLPAILRWRAGRAGGLLLSSAALLALAALVPVGVVATPRDERAPSPPPPLADVREWARQLREEKIVEPAALDALEEKTDALLRHAKDDWYKAGVMEAAGYLREQTEQTLQNLDKDLASIESAVAQAAAFLDKMPEPLAEALQKSLDEAVRGLDLSQLPLDSAQRAALRKLDMKALAKMSPEQLKALTEALRKNRAALARNGALKSGSCNSNGELLKDWIPAVLFAPGKKDPVDRLLDLVTPANAALARKAFAGLTPAEAEFIQKAVQEKRVGAFVEEGVKSGEVEGLVILPPTTAFPGVPLNDETLTDALFSLAVDPADRSPFTAEQRQDMVKALRENRVRLTTFSLKDSLGECKNPGLNIYGKPCIGICLKPGSCANPGRGGGGPEPLTLSRPPLSLAAKDKQHLEASGNETLGDLQGIGTGEHEVDKNAFRGPTAGGAASAGEGGESVWTDNFSPEERATLKTYFK
jgi:hypothetical protein